MSTPAQHEQSHEHDDPAEEFIDQNDVLAEVGDEAEGDHPMDEDEEAPEGTGEQLDIEQDDIVWEDNSIQQFTSITRNLSLPYLLIPHKHSLCPVAKMIWDIYGIFIPEKLLLDWEVMRIVWRRLGSVPMERWSLLAEWMVMFDYGEE
ncbi:hypothetical protein RHS01_05409 [Rhizoctonia solani]|uniref:Uncharacterized protein n=1 Tax=Rhizoctonia solani TaxID=456999 RepID=A0A8H7M591_9AGAM|nr:hypothetical protein RHS01_05409 [Rhizoctonia solani]